MILLGKITGRSKSNASQKNRLAKIFTTPQGDISCKLYSLTLKISNKKALLSTELFFNMRIERKKMSAPRFTLQHWTFIIEHYFRSKSYALLEACFRGHFRVY